MAARSPASRWASSEAPCRFIAMSGPQGQRTFHLAAPELAPGRDVGQFKTRHRPSPAELSLR
jgi:hypothetical protein